MLQNARTALVALEPGECSDCNLSRLARTAGRNYASSLSQNGVTEGEQAAGPTSLIGSDWG